MISFRKMAAKLLQENVWAGLSLLLSTLGSFLWLQESQWLDWRFQWRGYQQADPRLVLIAIRQPLSADHDANALTPRDTLASLLRKLTTYRPAVVGLDFSFHEEEKNDSAYVRLERILRATPNLVIPLQLEFTERGPTAGLMPPLRLQKEISTGFANFFHTSSYPPVRGLKLLAELEDGRKLPAFALVILEKYLTRDGQSRHWQEILAHYSYLVSPDEIFPLNYFGPVEAKCPAQNDAPCAKVYSFHEFMNTNFPVEWLAGKILLIGATFLPKNNATKSSDVFDTPFGAMRGVAIHANLINNLLTEQYLQPAGPVASLVWTGMAIALAMLAFWRLRLKWAVVTALSGLLIYVISSFILFQTHLLILPMAWPLKAGVLSFLLAWYARSIPARKIRDYLDFEILAVKSHRAGRHSLRIIAAPSQAGDAEAETTFEDWPTLTSDCQRLAQERTDKDFLKSLGHRLYQHLLVDKINACYERSLTQARMEKKGLRLRLRLEAPELRVIPWEFLYDRNNDFFFAQHPEILLTRYAESEQPQRELAVQGLDVLIVLSQPAPASLWQSGLSELEVSKEKDLIITALQELRERATIPIRWTVLDHAVASDLRKQLREGYHIFHFIGHSTFRQNQCHVVLENEQHEAQLCDEETFSGFFLDATTIRLVLMNSCKSAASAALPALNGLAYQLLQRGIPAVVGMQYNISDETAALFAKEFYRTLAGGHPVDLALTYGRLAIAQEIGLDKIDFGGPVMFMRCRDGRILGKEGKIK